LADQAYDPKSDPNLEQLNDLYESVWNLLSVSSRFRKNVPIFTYVRGINHFRSMFLKEIVELS
jgi:hypothetical protein